MIQLSSGDYIVIKAAGGPHAPTRAVDLLQGAPDAREHNTGVSDSADRMTTPKRRPTHRVTMSQVGTSQ